MDNGSGDYYTIIFDAAGPLLFGFDHVSPAIPWHDPASGQWHCGPVEIDSLAPDQGEADGAIHLFGLLADGSPQDA